MSIGADHDVETKLLVPRSWRVEGADRRVHPTWLMPFPAAGGAYVVVKSMQGVPRNPQARGLVWL